MCCAGCGWRAGELPSRQLAARFPQGGQHSICTYLHRLCTPVFAQACTHIDIIDFDINPDRIAPAGEQALPPIELRLLLDLRGMNCHKSQPLSLPRFLIAVRSKCECHHAEEIVIQKEMPSTYLSRILLFSLRKSKNDL
jgi:hypothetical protein